MKPFSARVIKLQGEEILKKNGFEGEPAIGDIVTIETKEYKVAGVGYSFTNKDGSREPFVVINRPKTESEVGIPDELPEIHTK